jgi:hypothetical protein
MISAEMVVAYHNQLQNDSHAQYKPKQLVERELLMDLFEIHCQSFLQD